MPHQKLTGQEDLQKILEEIPVGLSCALEERMILYWMLRAAKPEVVIETGTHAGLTTLFIAEALYDNNKGMLHSADISKDWYQRENINKFLHLKERITLHYKKGVEMLAEIDKVDFAFVDGEHTLEEVIAEIDALWPKLSKGATVIFHDPKLKGVKEAFILKKLKVGIINSEFGLAIYKHD